METKKVATEYRMSHWAQVLKTQQEISCNPFGCILFYMQYRVSIEPSPFFLKFSDVSISISIAFLLQHIRDGAIIVFN